MDAVWTLAGLRIVLAAIENIGGSDDINSLTVRLFTNDETPAINSVPSDFDEVNANNYEALAMSDSDPVWVEGSSDSTYFGSGTFLFHPYESGGGDTTVRGAYVTQDNGPTLMFAHRFDTPLVFSEDGQQDFSLPITISVRQAFS